MLPMIVHFKENSMATILSLKTVSEIKGSRLTMDTAVTKGIELTLENGDSYTFNMYENGLYFFDTNNTDHFVKSKSQLSNYSLLQTVTDNKTYFSKQEIKGADTSRQIQEYLYYPGTKTLEHYISQNLITNCEITADDVNRAELIYGTPVPYLQGHMVRRKPPIHEKIEKSLCHQ